MMGLSIKLPEPRLDSTTSVEKALRQRRSVRRYETGPVDLADLGQLLWAGQGISHARGFRTAPSAGALYPLELYLVVGNVHHFGRGVYRYLPQNHSLLQVSAADKRAALAAAALGQGAVLNGAAVIVLAAVYERVTSKYGARGERYVHMEAGHAAQNIYLEAAAMGIATVVIGAFRDMEVKLVLDMKDDEQPLYIMPVGRKN